MKKYRYLEFSDKAIKTVGKKTDLIYCSDKVSDDTISELALEKVTKYGDKVLYCTTISDMGLRGWRLKFVTPCAMDSLNDSNYYKSIENLYIFEKEVDEE